LRPVHRTRKERLLTALALIFVCGVAFGVSRIGAFALAVMSPLQAAVMLAAVVGGAALTAYSLSSQIMPGSVHRIRPQILPFAVILSLALATVLVFQFQHERNFWAASWWCIRAGTGFGALAAVPLWLVSRRGAVLSPITTRLAGGLFAGLVGTSVLEIHCPILDAWHILFAHLGVSVLFTALAIAAGWVLDNGAAVAEKAKIIWQRP
jgi:Negative regulator of sigma F